VTECDGWSFGQKSHDPIDCKAEQHSNRRVGFSFVNRIGSREGRAVPSIIVVFHIYWHSRLEWRQASLKEHQNKNIEQSQEKRAPKSMHV
jgi:hypothetical protein